MRVTTLRKFVLECDTCKAKRTVITEREPNRYDMPHGWTRFCDPYWITYEPQIRLGEKDRCPACSLAYLEEKAAEVREAAGIEVAVPVPEPAYVLKCDDCGGLHAGDLLSDPRTGTVPFGWSRTPFLKVGTNEEAHVVMHCPDCTLIRWLDALSRRWHHAEVTSKGNRLIWWLSTLDLHELRHHEHFLSRAMSPALRAAFEHAASGLRSYGLAWEGRGRVYDENGRVAVHLPWNGSGQISQDIADVSATGLVCDKHDYLATRHNDCTDRGVVTDFKFHIVYETLTWLAQAKARRTTR